MSSNVTRAPPAIRSSRRGSVSASTRFASTCLLTVASMVNTVSVPDAATSLCKVTLRSPLAAETFFSRLFRVTAPLPAPCP